MGEWLLITQAYNFFSFFFLNEALVRCHVAQDVSHDHAEVVSGCPASAAHTTGEKKQGKDIASLRCWIKTLRRNPDGGGGGVILVVSLFAKFLSWRR